MYRIFLILIVFQHYACSGNKNKELNINELKSTTTMDTATFGTGCFWCTEAIFSSLKGVISVEPGYSGGSLKNPSYEEVCSGNTGHAEVVQIVFDPNQISFLGLLEVFFKVHDPTSLNKQGADAGTQYRSVIFFHNELQHQSAKEIKLKLNESGAYDKPIVTEISAFDMFYKAENYHLDYYERNPNQPYCSAVIRPKVEKFKKVFQDLLK